VDACCGHQATALSTSYYQPAVMPVNLWNVWHTRLGVASLSNLYIRSYKTKKMLLHKLLLRMSVLVMLFFFYRKRYSLCAIVSEMTILHSQGIKYQCYNEFWSNCKGTRHLMLLAQSAVHSWTKKPVCVFGPCAEAQCPDSST
jgi:hypothetical protein